MRTSRAVQALTYDVRLPDEAQADALRLREASRQVVNQALTLLWPYLDEFGKRTAGPTWKQVGTYTGSPNFHGDRQWRCESEVVGRLLRGQAERKKAFDLVAPILSDGFIHPQSEKRSAGKNRSAIKEAITTLQKSLEENETSFVTLQNIIEQACNFYFQSCSNPVEVACLHLSIRSDRVNSSIFSPYIKGCFYGLGGFPPTSSPSSDTIHKA
jgi:hypothetical protein